MGANINSVSEINSILVLYLLASMRKTVLTVILKKRDKNVFYLVKSTFCISAVSISRVFVFQVNHGRGGVVR